MFKRLTDEDLEHLLQRAEAVLGQAAAAHEPAQGKPSSAWPTATAARCSTSPRMSSPPRTSFAKPIEPEDLVPLVQRRAPLYDKNRDGHYDLISALHKAVRGSDPDAALYWLCRMLDGGEDPLYLARRMVRMAVEDIGLADPSALVQANAAKDAYDFLGSPEGELALAQCVIYLATAPKSNAGYTAFGAAMRYAKEGGSLPPPKHILNAPTKLMKQEGYGAGYIYDHSTEEGVSGQSYFPEGLDRQQFFRPRGRGYEREIEARLKKWAEIRGAGAKSGGKQEG